MIRVSVLEFFLRGIPESLLFVFSTYVFSKTILDKRRYALTTILNAVLLFIIRCLPIKLGVHTILGMIMLIVLNVFVNKFEVIKAIQAVIITYALEFLCEVLNVAFIQYVLRLDMNNAFSNNVTKILYSIPSLIFFALIIFIYYYILSKRKNKSNK